MVAALLGVGGGGDNDGARRCSSSNGHGRGEGELTVRFKTFFESGAFLTLLDASWPCTPYTSSS